MDSNYSFQKFIDDIGLVLTQCNIQIHYIEYLSGEYLFAVYGNISSIDSDNIHKQLCTLRFIKHVNIEKHRISVAVKIAYLLKAIGNKYTFQGDSNVLIDFCSANPTGYLHYAHLTNAIIGNGIANLLKEAGWNVHRQYYINDGGGQISKIMESIYNRIIHNATSDQYQGEMIDTLIKSIGFEKMENLQDFIDRYSDQVVDVIMESIKDNLNVFDISFDSFLKESEMIQYGDITIDYLNKSGYLGMAEDDINNDIPYDKDNSFGKKLILNTKKNGDDNNRTIRRNNGAWTYLGCDIMHFLHYYNKGYQRQIIVVGEDHHMYTKTLQNILSIIAPLLKFEYVIIGSISVNGELMSKRNNTVINVKDIISSNIDKNALKSHILYSKSTNTQCINSMRDLDAQYNKTPGYKVYYNSTVYIKRIMDIIQKYEDTYTPDQKIIQSSDPLLPEEYIEVLQKIIHTQRQIYTSSVSLSYTVIMQTLNGLTRSIGKLLDIQAPIDERMDVINSKMYILYQSKIVLIKLRNIIGVVYDFETEI